MAEEKKRTIFGQDIEILIAVWANILSWLVSTFAPSLTEKLITKHEAEEADPDDSSESKIAENDDDTIHCKCVSIGRPGGLEQLRVVTLKADRVTVGYNIKEFCLPPFTPSLKKEKIPDDCVLIKNKCFSVNYADCTIRWGLYESAKQFVGWPIVAGFDVAGEILASGGSDSDLKKGDSVFGCTLFGSYSSHILIPKIQLRKIPTHLNFSQACSLPAVSLTALHALALAGHYPQNLSKYNNKAILIHSCAGGVGSMLVQMSKILGLGPIVGVVGSSSKVQAAKDLGCDVVIDKSSQNNSNWWKLVKDASPSGYSAVMDANGVTLQESYDNLCPTGRLIVYGFHSNLPLGKDMLAPKQWYQMVKNLGKVPKIDPMDLTVSNKCVMGFNLSFFSEEKEVCSMYFDQIYEWLESKQLKCPKIAEFEKMEDIGKAHQLIQSGKSIGKIVVHTN